LINSGGLNMHSRTTSRAALTLLVATAAAHSGAEPGIDMIPDGLQPPSGQVLALAVQGTGVQIYECKAAKEDPSRFSWTLKAPEADLKDLSGNFVGKHYAGPTWEASDGSKVVGEVVAKHDAPDPASIPWLLLRAKSTSGSGLFSAIASIQRLQTSGGSAPALKCDNSQSGKESRVPYSALYRFYKGG
jgi:hypothetical protein